jgi:hypothetical protein
MQIHLLIPFLVHDHFCFSGQLNVSVPLRFYQMRSASASLMSDKKNALKRRYLHDNRFIDSLGALTGCLINSIYFEASDER